jgi:hypothetical protein
MADESHQNKKKPQGNNNLEVDADPSLVRRVPNGATGQSNGMTSPYLKGAENTLGKGLNDDDRTRIMGGDPPANQSPDDATAVRKHSELGDFSKLSKQTPAHTVLKNRFVLEHILGVGGMGVVYRAKDLRKVEARDRNPYLAVKILNDEFRKHPDAVIALQREARKSQSIAHPNIVNVHDFDRDGDTVFMTMEYLDGKPLDKLLRDHLGRGLKPQYAMEIFKGMCAALQHAHAENIVHADFKPGNVFTTRTGVTKVFDFGIARAVAQVDSRLLHQDNTLFSPTAFTKDTAPASAPEQSVFDPNTLGALTPTYASVEMLQGETPTIQDDIYALGIVTYELFAGSHPYQRVNALDAMTRNLKPKRIKSLSRQQWKVLKSALAFQREDRPDSVYEFFYDFTHAPQSPLKKWLATAAVLALGVGIGVGVYTQYFYEKPLSPEELKAQLELQIKFDIVKKNITALLQDMSFSERWQDNIWQEVQGARELMGMENPWLLDVEKQIVQRYLAQVQQKRASDQFTKARTLLADAERYRGDTAALEQERLALADALLRYQAKQDSLADERQRLEAERAQKLAAQRKAKEKARQQALEDKRRAAKQAKLEEEQAEKDVFALALNNVKQQLRCKGDLGEKRLKAAVDKLKSVDAKRYQLEVPGIVSGIGVCIERIGQQDSNRALDLKKFALGLFPGNRVLANLKITPKDPCGEMLAGFGARGLKGTCRDRLDNGAYGPRMVVIPASQGTPVYAIGQFEISVDEINAFCAQTRQCKSLSGNENIPATNIPFDTAKAYARWLSRNTGYTYRIPRYKEWLYAAQAKNSPLDDNRNCTLNARGINKGEQLENITTGKKNRWGLVNHVGNAQEWVLVNNRDLAAAGGAHTDPMQKCQYTTQKDHDGSPDPVTGFRVVRELKKL